VQEAKSNESDDRKARDLAEARNNADNLVYVTEKSLRELGDKVPANDRGQIEQIIEELKAARETGDLARIRSLTDRLQQASHALTQQMYSQAGGTENGGPGAPGGEPGQSDRSDDDVVEGEYRAV
jgi:molecular chaperone DnaK